MIYVMSQKVFKKYAKKILKYAEFFIIDGENWSVTSHSEDEAAIASSYPMAYSVGSFSPETRLWSMLKDLKRGHEVSESKLRNEVSIYFKDKAFVGSVNLAYKSLVASGTDTRNGYVVLPNLVYKYLGEAIVKRMRKLGEKGGLDFHCVYSQDRIKDDPKCVKKLLKKKELAQVDKASKWIEKHYKLTYKDNMD